MGNFYKTIYECSSPLVPVNGAHVIHKRATTQLGSVHSSVSFSHGYITRVTPGEPHRLQPTNESELSVPTPT